jgi:ribonuclease P protein component
MPQKPEDNRVSPLPCEAVGGQARATGGSAETRPESTQPLGAAPPRRGLRFERRMRLVRRGDFERAYRAGTRAKGSALVVLTSPGPQALTRLGLSIGKKAWREAVDRNRARRLIREAFRLEFERLPQHLDMAADPRGPWDLHSLRGELVELAWRAHKKLERRRAESGAPGPALP